ncbi:MAG: Carbamoyl-phosphate synthase small chain [Alphaproteobacteria bacterium MarineAlpha5_Bin8]|nr:MAG: Carbamoyl-phosphate synthase small chain [Alphaproteobacteria bacterium MarineAlpha5_Bin7]PPR47887.1 MAG: Carbamoyl-phosphate synthase small chain [Alphaproteobacteria bacterium MarineAlpha5_Bin8]PPR52617.1 MAG: Carbamoyl-phosphate synthase small chain [Alphaproteobacteria bacterium MarineAlpha5_Bin6]|tara:strand:- start:480 stop:1667 length:1188 start_codon:yes stop_codon:yes gene_type:complete
MLKEIDSYPQLRPPSAALILENGTIFWGYGIGAIKASVAELCFNTSQTGYQETITDPSYSKQIICFTFPHIGIVGSNKIDNESKRVYASGCVINQPISSFSNWRAEKSIDFFFKKKNVPCIYNIDTRQLTKLLSEKGAFKAAIVNFGKNKRKLELLKKDLKNWSGLENLDLASLVSTKKKYSWKEGIWNENLHKYNKNNSFQYSITCIDFGIKNNILRNLSNLDFKSTILNAKCTLKDIVNTKPDGIFLSNGPGDPFATGEHVIPIIKELINLKIPIFGICLGHQILSLALGAKTTKMFQGHRGCNHPVKNLITSEVEITSQNHGFEVDKNTLPNDITETHISLFDNSNEGIMHNNLPIFSVQYHPEASPGPHDSHYLFKEFYKIVNRYAKKKRY